jgi:hypothetical protein
MDSGRGNTVSNRTPRPELETTAKVVSICLWAFALDMRISTLDIKCGKTTVDGVDTAFALRRFLISADNLHHTWLKVNERKTGGGAKKDSPNAHKGALKRFESKFTP